MDNTGNKQFYSAPQSEVSELEVQYVLMDATGENWEEIED